ncbi:hypothetical protein D9619_013589 [Psilocybe cf. subviscida]|uniref:Uncharacterized protein n=1 Tax=Psilocybe cf. subviscida TaxID=2480587 RepID=A0A8H5EQQ3_9AGAR|nr:hypothetical protein D9619_013589 [Psilocybe cf. subviscida]
MAFGQLETGESAYPVLTSRTINSPSPVRVLYNHCKPIPRYPALVAMDFLLPSQAMAATGMILPPTTTQQYDAEDHVMWQSSQSIALKDLLHTPDEEVRTSRGWQREPSFDQIPGFSRLSTSDASTPSNARQAPVRPRRAQSPSILATSSKPELPVKADPIQFLHLMKDVSARLDQNVPVRPRSTLGPERTRTDRKTRSSATPFPPSRPAKRSRIEALRSEEPDGGVPTIDKGKGKAQPAEIASPGPSQDFTLSQIQMPPPPGPSSKRHFTSPLPSTTLVPAKQHQQSLPPKQPRLPPESPVPSVHLAKPQVPRAQTSAPKPPAVDRPPEVAQDRRPAHASTIPASTHSVTPQPPSASQSAARPPSLGMRRTNTFPMATSLQKNSALPTRQKGFKPPLLSGSQPQPSSQQKVPTSNSIRPTVCTGVLSRSSSESPSASSSFSSNSTSTSTATNSVSSSSRSTRSSASPAPFEYSAKKAAAAKSSAARLASIRNSLSEPIDIVDDDTVDLLPEPLDGDPDSSFGDMSFDIDADALEATMRLYD